MCSGPDFSRDSAGGAEERNAPQPEGIDGPRRAQRPLRLLLQISPMALMKGLHQKKTKRKQAIAAASAWSSPNPFEGGPNLSVLTVAPGTSPGPKAFKR